MADVSLRGTGNNKVTIQLPLRMALGGVVSNIDSDVEGPRDFSDEAIEAFFAGGGSAYLNMAYPLYNKGRPEGAGQATLFFLLRLGFAVPALGSQTDDVSLNFDAVLELHLSVLSASDPIQLFGQIRAGQIWGTDDFYADVGIGGPDALNRPDFSGDSEP